MSLLFIYWNPSRIFFSLPFINVSVTFYGCLFATGFVLAVNLFFLILKKYFSDNNSVVPSCFLNKFFDRLCFYGALSVIVGARLGHVLFYDLPFYLKNPLDILKIWEGGLASYGGTIAIFICLYVLSFFYKKKIPALSFFLLTDIASIVFGIFASTIRLGNFFNQEILGTKTDKPWGVYFAKSHYCIKEGPVHPVQMYEAFFYLSLFVSLLICWKNKKLSLGKGVVTSFTCIIVSIGRFVLEFYKDHTSLLLPENFLLTMGQLLSVPLFTLGVFLFFRRIEN